MTKEDIEKYNYHYDLAGDLANEVMILDNVSPEKNDKTIEVANKAIAHYNECIRT